MGRTGDFPYSTYASKQLLSFHLKRDQHFLYLVSRCLYSICQNKEFFWNSKMLLWCKGNAW